MAKIEDVISVFLSKEQMAQKKLQGLIYYFYVWGLTFYEKNLIEDDTIEVTETGPISLKLYDKSYKWNTVEKDKKRLSLTEEEEYLLESVWITYGQLSDNEIMVLIKGEKPWKKARLEKERFLNKETIKEFYSSIYIG